MTNTPAHPIIEHMSDIATERTTERNPPTLADIVREKTDNGRRIIDFFLDVMEDRIVGAQLCHRMHAARQLQKLGSSGTPPSSLPSTAASPAVTRTVDAPSPADLIRCSLKSLSPLWALRGKSSP